MKSIQKSVLDGAVARMFEAKQNGNKDVFDDAKRTIENALDCIENADVATHEEYKHYLDEVYE